jgi:hypothetical protein
MNQSRFPAGWDEERVQRLIEYYDSLSDEEQVAEDEAAVSEQKGQVIITVPSVRCRAVWLH